MRLSNRTIFLGIVGLTVLSGIVLSPAGALIVFFGTSILLLFRDIKQHVRSRHKHLEEELATIKRELASKSGLPLVGKYMQLTEDACPLFQRAAHDVYEKAMTELNSLANFELVVYQQTDVFRHLEFLFRDLTTVKTIRAASWGEFDEWSETESWWGKKYLELHHAAHKRGVKIERIFIVNSKQQERAAAGIFKKNLDHYVTVKVALQSRISAADFQAANCLLFYAEQVDPVYALVASHDAQGHFQRAIIYGDPSHIRAITEMYDRIDGIARRYPVLVAA